MPGGLLPYVPGGSTANPYTSGKTNAQGTTSPTAPQMVSAIGYADQMYKDYGSMTMRQLQQIAGTSSQPEMNYMQWMRQQNLLAQYRNPQMAQQQPGQAFQDVMQAGLLAAKTALWAMPGGGVPGPVMDLIGKYGMGLVQQMQQPTAPPYQSVQEVANLPYTALPQNPNMPISDKVGYGEGETFGSIDYLEKSYEARKAQVAKEAYQWNDATQEWKMIPGKEVLGMAPGTVSAFMPRRPDPGAPIEEWKAYEQQLRQTIHKPLYTRDVYQEEFNRLGTEGIKNFQKRMVAAGLYPENEPVILGVVKDFEQNSMIDLMSWGNANGLTYDQVLDELIKQRKQAQASGGGGGGGAGGAYTQVTYSTTSLAQARQVLSAVLKNSIGRNPTEDEVTRFLRTLNAEERKSPTITTTTATGRTSVSRTSPTKVDPQQMALDFVKQIGGGGEFDENRALHYLNLIAKKYGYDYGQG